jgi:hypothetical protein
VSSRRRPYLKLKQSFLELFRGQARWLKELTAKESIFEKPYLDQDYRAMHLDLPTPDWPSGRVAEPSLFPEGIGRSWFWGPAQCSFFILGSVACGETVTFTARMNLVPPLDEAGFFAWEVESSEPENVKVVSVVPNAFTTIVKVTLEVADDFDGTAVIAVRSRLIGSYVKFLRIELPPHLLSGSIRYEQAATLPYLQREEYTGLVHDCGEQDVASVCCGDCLVESPTISYTTQGMQVDETQNLSVTNYGAIPGDCFTWAISSGGGSLSAVRGYATVYTAPSSNADCASNPTITLSCNAIAADTLEIAVNAYVGGVEAYSVADTCSANFYCSGGTGCANIGDSNYACELTKSYDCTGVYKAAWTSFYAYRAHIGGGVYEWSIYSCNLVYMGVKCADAVGGCGCLSVFNGDYFTHDLRTGAMISGGCCPEALL